MAHPSHEACKAERQQPGQLGRGGDLQALEAAPDREHGLGKHPGLQTRQAAQ